MIRDNIKLIPDPDNPGHGHIQYAYPEIKPLELLEDNRFGALFTDERFEVDTTEETYRLLNPVVSKLDKDKRKEFDAKYGVRESGSEGEGGDSEEISLWVQG